MYVCNVYNVYMTICIIWMDGWIWMDVWMYGLIWMDMDGYGWMD